MPLDNIADDPVISADDVSVDISELGEGSDDDADVVNVDSIDSMSDTEPTSSLTSAPTNTLLTNSTDSDSLESASTSKHASHLPVRSKCSDGLMFSIPNIHFSGVSKADFIKYQREDESLKQIWEWAKNNERRCFVVDGILMCLTSTNGCLSHSLVVPKHLRLTILKLAHDQSGHFGSGATHALINPYFTWPNLN